MFTKNQFCLTTIGLAIALTMGGCASPVDELDRADAPASNEVSEAPTGEVSSAMWGAPIAAPVAPVGWGAWGTCGVPLAAGWGIGVAAPLAAPVPAVGFGAPLVGSAWGCAGVAPAIGFRADDAEGAASDAPSE